jgi:cytochrome c biogenesis protein CcmG/thiol:disulfide interchange protein DsbE
MPNVGPTRSRNTLSGVTASRRRPVVPIVVGVLAAALVGLLVYGVVRGGQDTTLDDAVKAGKRPNAPGQGLKRPVLGAAGDKSLADYKGQVVVLNFWASWCGPCQAEAPGLVALSSQLRSRGVRFLGDDVNDDPTSAKAFMQSNQISYPSLNDPGEQVALAFHSTVSLDSIPSTLVIDRTGHIAGRILGSVTYDSLRSLIARISGDHLTTASGATP